MGTSPTESRAGNGSPLAHRKSNGVETDALGRIEARLARIEAQLERIPDDAKSVVATATDAIDRATENAADRGIDVDDRVHRALALVERLTEPRTMDALEQLVALARDGHGLVATAVDTVDGQLAALESRGIEVDTRLTDLLRLVERLSEPRTMESLEKGLEFAADAQGLVATLTDTVDGRLAALQFRGVEVDARLETMARLVERLTSPAVTESLEQGLSLAAEAKHLSATGVDVIDGAINRLADRGIDVHARIEQLTRIVEKATRPAALDNLEELVEMLPEAKNLMSTAVDTFDTYANQIVESGMNLQKRLSKLGVAVDRLTKEPVLELLEQVTERTTWFQKVVESTLLSRDTSRVLLAAVQSVEAAASADPPSVGPFRAFGQLNNEDVKRATGFTFRLLAHLGARLKDDHRPPCELPE